MRLAVGSGFRATPRVGGGGPAGASGGTGLAGPAAAVLVALIAIVLPPGRTAVALVGRTSPLLADITAGVWLLKGLLLLHAAGILVLARWFARAQPGRPLMARVRSKRPVTPVRAGFLLTALALGLVLRLIDLDGGLWHDEISTLVNYARLSVREIIASYGSQNQHVLYSILSSLSLSVLGESSWSLRLPAALAGVAGLFAVFQFGSLITSRREAILATLVLAVSYHHIWFSQNARGYTIMMFLAVVATGYFVRLLEAEGRRPWPLVLGYAISMALATYTHLTAAFIAATHLVIWGVMAFQQRGRRTGSWARAPFAAIVLAGSLTALLYAIVLPQIIQTLFTPSVEFSGDTPWQNPLWLVAETLRGASRGLPGGWIGLAGGMTVAGAGLLGYLRRSKPVVALMVAPVAVSALVLAGMGHNLWPRFFFFAAGFAVLIAVRGTFVLVELLPMRRRRTLATFLLVLIAAASATTVPRAWAPKQDYEGALRFVTNNRESDDAVVAVGLAAYAYESWLGARVTAVTDESQLAAIESRHARTWLLYAMPEHLAGQSPELWSKIGGQYREMVEYPGTVAGGTVHVMMRR